MLDETPARGRGGSFGPDEKEGSAMRLSTLVKVALCVALACSVVMISPPGVSEAMHSGEWHWLNPLPRGETLNAVDMVNESVSFAVGNFGCIIKTYDGGDSWIRKWPDTTNDLTAVSFINTSTGWVGGEGGIILKTTDGGASWTQQRAGATSDKITGLQFIDALRGWASDYTGTVLRTTDGGATWQSATRDALSSTVSAAHPSTAAAIAYSL